MSFEDPSGEVTVGRKAVGVDVEHGATTGLREQYADVEQWEQENGITTSTKEPRHA